MMIVLDTTAFSAAMRKEPEMMDFLKQYRPGNIRTVPPVVAEIEYGIQRFNDSGRKHRLLSIQRDNLLQLIGVLPWNEDSSRRFGRIKAVLERKGTIIDDFDIAIAAIALSHSAEIITANIAHFGRITDLTFRHWRG